MTIGGSILLIVLGAIVAFAVEVDVAGIDLYTVGVILMIGGAVGLVFGLFRLTQTRNRGDRVAEDREPL